MGVDMLSHPSLIAAQNHIFGGRIGSGHRLTAFGHLGDFVILAMKATEVAPDGHYGIGKRTGLKVKKRLFSSGPRYGRRACRNSG